MLFVLKLKHKIEFSPLILIRVCRIYILCKILKILEKNFIVIKIC